VLDTALLASIAQQMMGSNTVAVNGKSVSVRRTRGHRLKMLAFVMDGRGYLAIQQNAEKPNRFITNLASRKNYHYRSMLVLFSSWHDKSSLLQEVNAQTTK
jgi:hypothetical protein